MAIDTRNKRLSLLGLALASVSVLPNPDGGIDTAAERQQYLWLYAGITASSPTVLPDFLDSRNVELTPARRNVDVTGARRNVWIS